LMRSRHSHLSRQELFGPATRHKSSPMIAANYKE
jgi:hypothetical protein